MKQILSEKGIEISIDVDENVSDSAEQKIFSILKKSLRKTSYVVKKDKKRPRYWDNDDTREEASDDNDNESEHDDNESEHDDNESEHDENESEHNENESEHNENESEHDENENEHDENENEHDENEGDNSSGYDSESSYNDTEDEEVRDTDDEVDILKDILGYYMKEKQENEKTLDLSIHKKNFLLLKKTIKELAKKKTDIPYLLYGLSKEERHWAHKNIDRIEDIKIRTWSMNVNHERVFYIKIDSLE